MMINRNLVLSVTLVLYGFSLGVRRQHDGPAISEYFRSKHFVSQGHVRRQLRHPGIPIEQKEGILNNYMKKPFNAQPNPAKSPERKPWRTALSAKTGSTLILATQNDLNSKMRQSIFSGFDRNGNSLFETEQTVPMTVKTKTTFTDGVSTTIFVKDANGPVVRNERFRFGFNQNGEVNHFESLNKPVLFTQPDTMSKMALPPG